MILGFLMSLLTFITTISPIPIALNSAPPTFSINTVVLIGIFLLISWIVRVIIYKDVTKRQKEKMELEEKERERDKDEYY